MRYVLPMEGDYAVLHPVVPESEAIMVIGHINGLETDKRITMVSIAHMF